MALQASSNHYTEAAKVKLLHILNITITTGFSTFLLSTRSRIYGTHFLNVVQRNRVTVQIFVQMMAHTLAVLQIYALRTTFNFTSRLRLARRPFTLEELAFCNALSNAQIDWNLPYNYLVILVAIVVLFMLPGALWAGALTPVVVFNLPYQSEIQLPAYSTFSESVWNTEFELRDNIQVWNHVNNCQQVHNRRGNIPSCPVPALQGLLISSASTATTIDGGLRLHSKFDNPEWTYMGRSYGAGSSVQLSLVRFPQANSSAQVPVYSYLEQGYVPEVTCIRNSSSNVTIIFGIAGVGLDAISIFYLYGQLPNEISAETEFYPLPAFSPSAQDLCAWAARSNSRNMITIAAGVGNYSRLDKVQCEVIFTPTTFAVAVNTTNQSITVVPTADRANDIEPRKSLIFNTIESINLISRMTNTLYASTLGNALSLNVLNMQERIDSTNELSITSAVADSFAAMIDDILVAYGASQLVISKDTTTVPVSGTGHGVQIGSATYTFLAFAFNACVALIVLFELLRTKFWHHLSKFNYTDVKRTVVAASAGGPGIAQRLSHHNDIGPDRWAGEAHDSAFQKLEVSIQASSIIRGMVAIGPAAQRDFPLKSLGPSAPGLGMWTVGDVTNRIKRKPLPRTYEQLIEGDM